MVQRSMIGSGATGFVTMGRASPAVAIAANLLSLRGTSPAGCCHRRRRVGASNSSAVYSDFCVPGLAPSRWPSGVRTSI